AAPRASPSHGPATRRASRRRHFFGWSWTFVFASSNLKGSAGFVGAWSLWHLAQTASSGFASPCFERSSHVNFASLFFSTSAVLNFTSRLPGPWHASQPTAPGAAAALTAASSFLASTG